MFAGSPKIHDVEHVKALRPELHHHPLRVARRSNRSVLDQRSVDLVERRSAKRVAALPPATPRGMEKQDASKVPTTNDIHGYCDLVERTASGIVLVLQAVLAKAPFAAPTLNTQQPPPAVPPPTP